MPVGRIILKSISESKKVSDLKSDGARLLYTWLITHLDVNGCFSGDPQVIKGKVFTRLDKTNKVVEDYLIDLEEVKLILRYQVNGDIFLNVPDFVDRQPSLNPEREAQTTIPLPTPDLIKSKSRVTPPQVKLSKDKISKDKYGKFVLLSKEEYKKLLDKFGKGKTDSLIEDLNFGIGSKGYKYKDHYLTILAWDKRNSKDKPKQDKIAGIKAYKDFVPIQSLTPEQMEESHKAREKVSKILKDKHITG